MKTTYTRRRILGAAVSLLVLALTSASLAFAARREGQPFHWSGRMRPGSTLVIRGINGSIETGPAPGAETVVEAEKWSQHGDPERVRIQVDEARDRTVIRARYPKRWFGIGADDVVVHFTVRVPRGVEVKLSTVNGSIQARNLQNRVVARTVNGGVHIDTGGEAEARTINGSITVRAIPRSGDLEFRTINGSVRLEIPSTASVRLSAHTLTGEIYSDIPATRIRGGFLGRSLEGRIGSGAAGLEIHTINGSIRLTRI